MNIITSRSTRGFWLTGLTLVSCGQLMACTTDDADPGASSGGMGGSVGGTGASMGGTSAGGTSGSTGTGGTGGSGGTGTTGTVCALPIALDSSAPGIADFESYTGGVLTEWSFPLGGDSVTGVVAGPFGYGDEPPDGVAPEAFEVVEGHDSTSALSVSDSMSETYGGGMGLWISECIDASALSGVSFWVRGETPTGMAKFKMRTEETTSWMDANAVGTCDGAEAACIAPVFEFPVTDGWTEVQIPWSDFSAGSASGTSIPTDGGKIWQVQFDVELAWVTDDEGNSTPEAAPFELVVDDMTFY